LHARRLRELIATAKLLGERDPLADDAEFDEWRGQVFQTLKVLFSDPGYVVRFQDIDFHPPRVRDVGMPYPRNDDRQYWKSGFQQVKKVLTDALEEADIQNQLTRGSVGNRPSSEERDAVTNLLKREALNLALPICFANAKSTGLPLSVIMVDIDHFKAVNDSRGHAKGDEVLREVADCVQLTVQGKGAAYRYGGEEITIVLQNHDHHEGTAVAERLRVALESRHPGGLAVTASLGVATYPTHAATQEELVGRADAAMYDSKNRGRNLVRAHGDAEPPTPAERVPPRRQPVPGGLTEAEAEAVRKEYFVEHLVRCPRDAAILEVR
jgi:diguanylate cyclase (GGDEF)-like protein